MIVTFRYDRVGIRRIQQDQTPFIAEAQRLDTLRPDSDRAHITGNFSKGRVQEYGASFVLEFTIQIVGTSSQYDPSGGIAPADPYQHLAIRCDFSQRHQVIAIINTIEIVNDLHTPLT